MTDATGVAIARAMSKRSGRMDLGLDTTFVRGTMEAGAHFSHDERHRYLLWRRWDTGPAALFIMLNPSTADHQQTDPTVERCMRRARMLGYPAIVVANAFALRATDPTKLYESPDPVGPHNDDSIAGCVSDAAVVVCGWGAHGRYMDRGAHVLRLIRDAGVTPYCLGTTKQGQPKHPLYIAYKTPLEAL